LRPIGDVRPHERSALLLAFLYFFFVLAAYYVIRPVRDQLGAANGSASLPLFYGIVFAFTLVLTPVYGWLVARYSRRRFVPVVYSFFILCLLGFVPLFERAIEPRLLGAAFFVWVSVFNLFVVSVFWSFMADVFSVEQAKRLFSTIALGGTAGSVAGPRLTSWLVDRIGVGPLLVVSAALLGGALLCVFALSAWSRRYPRQGPQEEKSANPDRAIGGNILAGARQVWQSPFLFRMALLMLLADCVGTVLYALLADIVRESYATPEARTAFYANVDFYSNTLQIVSQATLTRWLMTRYGPTPALVGPSLLNVVLLVGLALTGHPLAVAGAMVISRAGGYGMVQPARESLYTRVDREERYKAKNFIDTAVWRGGDVAVTTAMQGLQALGMALPGFALLSAAAAGGSAWIGARLTRSPGLHPEILPEPLPKPVPASA
jgi:ATP:ADP antiporter, AAA family